MDLVIIPDRSDAKVFFDRIRVVKMIRDKKVAFEIFRKVVVKVVEIKEIDQAGIVRVRRRWIRTL